MYRLWIALSCMAVSCSGSNHESGITNVAAQNSMTGMEQPIQLFPSSDATVHLNRSEILQLVQSGRTFFGYNIPSLNEALQEAFTNLSFESLDVQIQTRTLNIHFNTLKAFELSEENTVALAQTVRLKNWRIADGEYYLFDTEGLEYNSSPVQSIRYSESYGIEVLVDGEYLEFDINPILEFYDRHEKNIDAFMVSLEKPAAQSNGLMVADALQLFAWFSKTDANNKALIEPDVLANFYVKEHEQTDFMSRVLNKTVGLNIRPGTITAQLAQNRGLSLQLEDKNIYIKRKWILTHESPESVQIQGLMVAQDRVFRDDLWHPIYHARVLGESMRVTAWVKPGTLFKARNISTDVRL